MPANPKSTTPNAWPAVCGRGTIPHLILDLVRRARRGQPSAVASQPSWADQVVAFAMLGEKVPRRDIAITFGATEDDFLLRCDVEVLYQRKRGYWEMYVYLWNAMRMQPDPEVAAYAEKLICRHALGVMEALSPMGTQNLTEVIGYLFLVNGLLEDPDYRNEYFGRSPDEIQTGLPSSAAIQWPGGTLPGSDFPLPPLPWMTKNFLTQSTASSR